MRALKTLAVAGLATIQAACASKDLQPCVGAPWTDEVCILGGYFTLGHEKIPNDPPACQSFGSCGSYDESLQDFSPPVQARLEPFFIDRYPVSVEQYRACVEAASCPVDCLSRGQCGDGSYWDYRDTALNPYPALGLNYDAARRYCEWAGKRLPTEAEWERAARGPLSTDYPWGDNAPDCTRYPCDPGPLPFNWTYWLSYPIGSIPGDRSPEGVMEMVTNGQYVVADRYVNGYADIDPLNPSRPRMSDYDPYVVRPGRFSRELYNATEYPGPAWFRLASPEVGGVRCARDDVPATKPLRPLRANFAQKRQAILNGEGGQ